MSNSENKHRFAIVIDKDTLNNHFRFEAVTKHISNMAERELDAIKKKYEDYEIDHNKEHLFEGLSESSKKEIESIKHNLDKARSNKQFSNSKPQPKRNESKRGRSQ